ncbi:MAG TPA: L,D-transpeptidase [Actinomycetota bacterium]|nr:L,D-transpeptidase [Actinomycetota bacterium]
MTSTRFPRLLVAVCMLAFPACAGDADVAQTDPTPPPASPSASPAEEFELGELAPPDFAGGGLGLWTKDKFFTIYEKPTKSSRSTRLKAWNPLGQRLRLLVLDTAEMTEGGGWFKVLVPERPNGSKGWIRSDPKDMKVDQLPARIEVDLSERRLEYFEAGKLVRTARVGIGQDQYPTPTGTFYIWASVPQPSPTGPYGRFALGLSGFSPVLSDWPGGGRSAIHGTAVESDRGQKVSHGCVRVFNKDMRKLEKLPLGTPVLIEA